MAENFNVALMIDRTFTPNQRAKFMMSLRNIFPSFFDEFSEVCRINVFEQTSHCEAWASGKDLLSADVSTSEILFVYGTQRGSYPRSSIHFEQTRFGTTFVVSLSISVDDKTRSPKLGSCIEVIKELVESLKSSVFFGAGWELEFNAEATVEENMNNFLIDSSQYCWVGLPKYFGINPPRGFKEVSKSGGLIFYSQTNCS